jgi:hypothetical protein
MSDTTTVLKPFTTPSRRFTAGQSVTPRDIDGPLGFGDWQAMGFISKVEAGKPAGKARAASETAEASQQAEPPAAA